jgi:hypothetical protein
MVKFYQKWRIYHIYQNSHMQHMYKATYWYQILTALSLCDFLFLPSKCYGIISYKKKEAFPFLQSLFTSQNSLSTHYKYSEVTVPKVNAPSASL